jgi:hypothetical protein
MWSESGVLRAGPLPCPGSIPGGPNGSNRAPGGTLPLKHILSLLYHSSSSLRFHGNVLLLFISCLREIKIFCLTVESQ